MEDKGARSISCRAFATHRGGDTYGLRFELGNRGDTPLDLGTHEPFIAFSVLATCAGKPVPVDQPPLDIAVKPTTVHLPPAATVTIHTPIRLRITERADPESDGFVWTIACAREHVSLRIELSLPMPFSIGIPLVFE